MAEIVEYRDYELHIDPQGAGLKVGIRAKGSLTWRPELPSSPDTTRREQLIAEAKAVVDALLDYPHAKKKAED